MILGEFDIQLLRRVLLNNSYFKVQKAYIRGSYANNNYNSESDLDLLIISNDFIGIDILKRKGIIKTVLKDILKLKIDSICLTEYEYKLVRMNKEKIIRYDEMVEIVI